MNIAIYSLKKVRYSQVGGIMSSPSSDFKITNLYTEQQLTNAGYGITETEITKLSKWRFISQAVVNTWGYLTNLIHHTPEVNATIQRMDQLIQKELAEQDLETADLKTLDQYEKRCFNILGNIQTHENMVKQFAEKNLFLKDKSPVLASHIKEKEKVLEQINKIAGYKVALDISWEDLDSILTQTGSSKIIKEDDEKKGSVVKVQSENLAISMEPPSDALTQEMVDDLKRKIIDQQIDLSKADKNVLKKLYDQTNISPNDTPEFPVFFRLHLILHDSSPTYREIMEKIRNDSKETRPNLPEKTPITILPYDESKFDACWYNAKNAVCINMKKNTMDTKAGLGMIGSLIAFEATNAFQERQFAMIHKYAIAGIYETQYILGVDAYLTAMEEVEQHGITIQSRIIAEAMKNNPGIVDTTWDRYANYRARAGIGCFLNAHGDNYRKYYIEKIRPNVDKKFKAEFASGNKSHYAPYMFQLELRRRLEVENFDNR